MLESFPVLLIVSTALGFLAGIGVGGGSLLILWLTLLLQIEYPQAKVLNLLFFLPSAVIASIFRWKQGSLKLSKVFPAVLTGCIAAGVSAWIGTQFDSEFLKKIFGLLLIVTGFRELLYKPKKTNTGQN